MRKLALVLGLLAVFVPALAAAPASALSLGGIRNQLVQWVLDKVSVEGVFEISVDEVVDAEDEGTTLLGVEISDADGVWFTARELTFDFDRSRLLRGQLVIETLRLGGTEVMRQPVIPPGEEIEVDLEDADAPPEQFIWPRSPISTKIASVVIDDIHLHQPVLGHEISFDATGAFRDIGDIQAASLDLQRIDATEGRIDFEYARDFAANTLIVDLQASEAAGGLVASLLDLPAEVPTALTLTTDGTPDALNLAFDLDMPDYVEADGTATLAYAGPLSVDADFKARPGPLMPEQLAQVLGDEAELVVKAAEGDDQVLEIDEARISSPYLRATASGDYSRANGAADLQVELVAEPELAAPFEGVEFAGLTFAGTIQGEPGSLSADGDLRLQRFATAAAAVEQATLEIDVSQSGTAEQPTTDLSVQGRVTGLRLDQIPADVIGNARIDIAGSMTGAQVQLETASIDSEVLDVSASGTANTETGDFDVSYQIAAPQIAPVLEPYGIEARGTIDASGQAASQAGVLRLQTAADLTDLRHPLADAGRLHLEGTVAQEAERTTFDLSGSGEQLRIDQLGPDLLQRADLAASGTLEGETLTLDQARLTSPVLQATAEGTVQTDGSGGQIEYSISTEQIGPVAEAYGVDAQGTVSATGTVVLSPEGPTLTTDANLQDFRSELADAGRLHLEGTVAQVGERTTFDLTGAGERLRIDQIGPDLLGRAEFVARGALDGQQLTLTQAQLTSPLLDATAEGQVRIDASGGQIDYSISAEQIGPVAEAYGVDAQGTVSATGTVALSPDGPTLTTDANLQDFRSELADAGRLHLEGTVAQVGERTTFDLTGAGERLRIDRIGPDLLGRAEFVARGALDGQQLTLDQARLTSPLVDAAVEGTVNLETMAGRVEYDIGSVALGPVAEIYELPLTGTASATGVAELPAAGPDADAGTGPKVTGQAAVQDLAYGGTEVGDLALDHDVMLSETPNGTLDLKLSEGPFAPAAIATRFRLEGQRLALDGLDASALGMTASGDLAVNLDTTLAEGTLDIAAADLGRLPGAPVTGRADGRLSLSAEGGRQDATLTLAARDLTAAGIAIGAAQIDGQVRDALGTPSVDLDIAAERIVSGDLVLASATATVRGPLSAMEIALDAAGELDRLPLSLSAAARADLAGETMRATVRELELALGDERIALLEPLTVTSSGGATRFDELALALPDNGRLTGDLSYFGGPVAGTVQLDMPDISILARLFDAPVEAGALSVAADFDTRPGRADADIAITGRGIVFADISGAGVLGLDATVGWNGRRAAVDARLSGSFGEPLVIEAALPVPGQRRPARAGRSGPGVGPGAVERRDRRPMGAGAGARAYRHRRGGDRHRRLGRHLQPAVHRRPPDRRRHVPEPRSRNHPDWPQPRHRDRRGRRARA